MDLPSSQPRPLPNPSLVDGLNPQQKEAVEYRGHALLVLAGAGSGKTRVLTHRIASLIDTGDAYPSGILAITFTNKAASEMRERVERILGRGAEGMWISTFHSACVRILRNEAESFGFTRGFSIYDSQDTRVILKRLVKQQRADVFNLTARGVAARISRLKNDLVDPEAFARTISGEDPVQRQVLELYRSYQSELHAANAFDFDDLIAETVYLFRAFPKVADLYRRRFQHVLVDEYQDTNHAQYELIRELTRDAGADLTVVGDSDQSIYAFRGADIRNITEFERDFPEARTILLEQNYRSTQNILDAANSVIAHNGGARVKRLWSDHGAGSPIIGYTGFSAHDEAQFVADEIDRLHSDGIPYSDIAVFYRTNAQTRALEDVLIRTGLPYRILGGTRFYERAEIKDALGYLVAIANPRDDLAIRRIINVPKRGIGDVTVAQLAAFAQAGGLSLGEALDHVDEAGLAAKQTSSIRELASLLSELRASADPIDEVAQRVLDRTGYLAQLESSGDAQDQARAENLRELVSVVSEFQEENPEGTLVDFLTQVSLVAAADELDDASGTISLMTLHTAKGLEYPVVFLTGLEEELLPHRMSIQEIGGVEEERRLFYVGITRAQKRLYLTLALSRGQYGGPSASVPSRFLGEIPDGLVEWKGVPSGWGGSSRGELGWGSGERKYGSAAYGGAAAVDAAAAPRSRGSSTWAGTLTNEVRDNSDLSLEVGDRIRHTRFGEGTVEGITGSGAKRVAEVRFADGVRKKLLVKIAPIEKVGAPEGGGTVD